MLVGPVFEGRVVLITGGARGIGKCTAQALLERGCKVVLTDVDAEGLRATADELGAAAWRLDVSDAAAFAAVVEEVEQEVGPIDLLVNNAGIMRLGSFLESEPAAHDVQLSVNLHGVMSGMRAVLPRMIGRGRGHVVNIASTAGKVGTPFGAVYSASKHAVIGLSEGVRHEIAGTGVSLSYVCPAPVDTELLRGVKELKWPKPVGPEQVAAAVLRCVQTGKVDVYVPRSARLAAVLPALLPRRVSEGIGRLLGVNDLFVGVDREARAEYLARYGPGVK